jgi:hypothetical protein
MLEKDDIEIIDKLIGGCGMSFQLDSWRRIKKELEELSKPPATKSPELLDEWKRESQKCCCPHCNENK